MSEEVAGAGALLEENAQLRGKLHDACVLIGRLDFFLETYAGQSAATQKKQAAKLRNEIAHLGAVPQRPKVVVAVRRPTSKKPRSKS